MDADQFVGQTTLEFALRRSVLVLAERNHLVCRRPRQVLSCGNSCCCRYGFQTVPPVAARAGLRRPDPSSGSPAKHGSLCRSLMCDFWSPVPKGGSEDDPPEGCPRRDWRRRGSNRAGAADGIGRCHGVTLITPVSVCARAACTFPMYRKPVFSGSAAMIFTSRIRQLSSCSSGRAPGQG